MPETLIAVPHDIEAEALIEGFKREGCSCDSVQVGRLQAQYVSPLGLAVAVCGHGKAQFGIQAQHLIEHASRVKRLFCVGSAGRLDENLELGDVVVGAPTIEHDYKLRFVRKPLPRHRPDEVLLREFKATVQKHDFSFGVYFGPVASGDEDIVDPVRARELRISTEALCVAWEGSGGARAAQFNGLPFLEIRCLTDGADKKARSTFYESIEHAMPHAARLLIKWHSPTPE